MLSFHFKLRLQFISTQYQIFTKPSNSTYHCLKFCMICCLHHIGQMQVNTTMNENLPFQTLTVSHVHPEKTAKWKWPEEPKSLRMRTSFLLNQHAVFLCCCVIKKKWFIGWDLENTARLVNIILCRNYCMGNKNISTFLFQSIHCFINLKETFKWHSILRNFSVNTLPIWHFVLTSAFNEAVAVVAIVRERHCLL